MPSFIERRSMDFSTKVKRRTTAVALLGRRSLAFGIFDESLLPSVGANLLPQSIKPDIQGQAFVALSDAPMAASGVVLVYARCATDSSIRGKLFVHGFFKKPLKDPQPIACSLALAHLCVGLVETRYQAFKAQTRCIDMQCGDTAPQIRKMEKAQRSGGVRGREGKCVRTRGCAGADGRPLFMVRTGNVRVGEAGGLRGWGGRRVSLCGCEGRRSRSEGRRDGVVARRMISRKSRRDAEEDWTGQRTAVDKGKAEEGRRGRELGAERQEGSVICTLCTYSVVWNFACLQRRAACTVMNEPLQRTQ
ncbi:hypothetical protein EV421DRAFT_2022390 [Armillaria borealis]|uniref:Uncharacterized protein n=1 Tax=Armillaria borealis TaxID=47425 RepID=A0AA39J7N0_9AGAR|nr:hypothetical protein EV421DRAFT_2022390 [Armillaria borealis]